MANRTYIDKQYSLLKGLVQLYPVVAVGAAGAVTLRKRNFNQAGSLGAAVSYSLTDAPTSGVGYAVGDGFGVRSVSRTGTGAWTLTLQDPYTALVGVEVAQQVNASGAVVALAVGVVSTTNVTTNTAPGNGGVINLVLNDETGAADPASGTVVTLRITLINSTAP